jgi:trimethylamine--corrinoid protein Co-methyltransferase
MGWGTDLIAAGHQWINHVMSCLGKVGLAPFVGDNLGSKAFSPTLIVYADEIIAQARRLAQGFALDEDAVAFDDIEHAGPGGNYLTSDLTLKLFRNAYYNSGIWRRLTLEEWQDQGQPRADDLLRTYTRRLLEDARPPEDHAELMSRGEAFIHNLDC